MCYTCLSVTDRSLYWLSDQLLCVNPFYLKIKLIYIIIRIIQMFVKHMLVCTAAPPCGEVGYCTTWTWRGGPNRFRCGYTHLSRPEAQTARRWRHGVQGRGESRDLIPAPWWSGGVPTSTSVNTWWFNTLDLSPFTHRRLVGLPWQQDETLQDSTWLSK